MLKRSTLLLLLAVSSLSTLFAQNLWQIVSETDLDNTNLTRLIVPDVYQTATLDVTALNAQLATAPTEQFTTSFTSNTIISLPLPDGTTEQFRVWKSPVMHTDLAARYPSIQTFAGRSLADASTKVRFDVTPHGFHALISGANRTIYIDPYAKNLTTHYVVYHKKDFSSTKEFHCALDEAETGNLATDDTNVTPQPPKEESHAKAKMYCTEDVTLRTYRTAVACTGEYGTFHGGTVELALAAVVTTMNRVNSVYENDLAIRMVLVPNNDEIIFTNALTDPYVGNDQALVLLQESQIQIDARIGSANYDVGHTVSTGAGGVAFLGVICTNQKAGGITGTRNPVGDPFDIDYVSHEIGHQFGGNHTFNGDQGSCGGNGGSNVALEPGSGTTIQAYAGICSNDNIQPNSDPYFHVASLQEMGIHSRVEEGNDCPVKTPTTNTSPEIISATSGNVIPVATPFELTAEAVDAEGDELTYCWEQYDLGSSSTVDNPNATDGPIFRSFNPTLSPTRTFPQISDLIGNIQTFGEVLTNVSRTLSFRLTVRDNGTNSNNVGGLCFDDFAITTDAAAGPFLVTEPNNEGQSLVWENGVTKTITWDVANTDAAPINCSTVDIFLSTDGGRTFPTTLATGVDNNGSAAITVPTGITTNEARVKVKASDNIFFDLTNQNFRIGLESDALAVEWLNVQARAQTNGIQVNWQTANEQNVSHFNVERRTAEQSFATIADVQQKANSTYQFLDEKVQPATPYFYRLRQVATDGSVQYSPIVQATLTDSGQPTIALAPQPVLDRLNVKLTNWEQTAVQLAIYDMNGKLLRQQVADNELISVNLTNLADGMYVLKIWNDTREEVRKIVKKE